jgi:transglutaminase-like putative cysteine protease
MNRRSLFLGGALCVGCALLASDRPAERRFDFTYTVGLHNIPNGAKKVAVWIPYPGSDEHQEISDVRVICPYPTRVTKDPEYGNSSLYIEVDNPKEPSLDVEISFNVKREEYVRRDFDKTGVAAPSAEAISAHDLGADHFVPLNDRVRKLGAEVTAGKTNDTDKARAIYDYVVGTMKYDKSGSGWGNGDILWACDAKRGNCTDFHALFIGLCRAVGIPARFSIGFPLPETRGGGDIPGYHCWAEFFLKGYGWVPVDASEAAKHPEKKGYFFGGNDENRVQLSRGRDIVLNPKQVGPPLNYFVYPYAEVDGRPFDDVTKRFAFRDHVPGQG